MEDRAKSIVDSTACSVGPDTAVEAPMIDNQQGATLGAHDPLIDVSCIIVNWNTKELLRNCLDSIQRHTTATRYEIIVVDNASTDGSQHMMARDYPHVHLHVNRRNIGFAAANNQGFKLARGRYLLLLNTDTVVWRDAIDVLRLYMDSHMDIGASGPRLLNDDCSLQTSSYPFPNVARDALIVLEVTRWPIAGRLARWYGRRRTARVSSQSNRVDWVTGACMMLRRAAIEQVGVFDDRYFFGSEELDLCYRLRRHGWPTAYLPHAEVVHLGGQSRQRISAAHLNWYFAGWLRFYRTHYGRRNYLAFRVVILVSSLGHIIWLSLQRRQSLDNHLLVSAYARLCARVISS